MLRVEKQLSTHHLQLAHGATRSSQPSAPIFGSVPLCLVRKRTIWLRVPFSSGAWARIRNSDRSMPTELSFARCLRSTACARGERGVRQPLSTLDGFPLPIFKPPNSSRTRQIIIPKPLCNHPRVEIDERLHGCIQCNQWMNADGDWIRLPEADIAALRAPSRQR